MKKAGKILGIILGILLLAILGLGAASKFYYKRSIRATLAEYYLRVTIKHWSLEKLEKGLEEKKKAEEKPYQLPNSLKIEGGVENEEFQGMPVLYMNRKGRGRVILYLHGGSYLHEPDPHHFDFLDKLIKKTDAKIIFPVYPKAPKHDFLETYRLLTEFYKEWEGEEMVLMGDSAGGGLIFGFWQYLDSLQLDLPLGMIAFSPWIDLTMENPEIENFEKIDPWLRRIPTNPIARAWANGEDLKDYRISPMFGKTDSFRNVTIFIGTREILYPDAVKFVGKMKENKVNVNLVVGKGMNHVYPLFPIPEAEEAIEEVTKILKEME